jgi:predicted kinase
MVLVQMSGTPGAGKSTIARELVRRRRLVALDLDVVQSSLMDNGEYDVDNLGVLKRASYGVVKALAADILAQGVGVVIDSPCSYDVLLDDGQALAAKYGVPYRYIECVSDDIPLLDSRLRSRPALRSQRLSVDTPPVDLPADLTRSGTELFAHWIGNMVRPDTYLRLDTTRPLDVCVAEALTFLETGGCAQNDKKSVDRPV